MTKVFELKNLQPRVIRLKNAPWYLGMDIHRFNDIVRPYVTNIKLGRAGVGFDRLDLDAWLEEYKQRDDRSINL